MTETTTFDRQIARTAVGAYDDAQDLRQASMNRVRDMVRKRNEDIPFDEVEEEKDDDDYSTMYEDENLPELIGEMLSSGKLSPREHQYLDSMLTAAELAGKIEGHYQKMFRVVENEPIYGEYLDHVYGVSSTLTARLLHQFGYCEDFDRVSQLWSYSGWGPRQRRERGRQLDFNPEAKQVAWMVSDCMIRCGSNSQYRTEFYEPYKEKQLRRLEAVEDLEEDVDYEVRRVAKIDGEYVTVEEGGDLDSDDEVHTKLMTFYVDGGPIFEGSPPNSKGHADARARRYLAKKFLAHYWYAARQLQGLETPDEWILSHGGHEKREESFENPEYALGVLRGER